MITTEQWDAVIVCHGCESGCSAGFVGERLIPKEMDCPECGLVNRGMQHRHARIKAYMREIKKCPKLLVYPPTRTR